MKSSNVHSMGGMGAGWARRAAYACDRTQVEQGRLASLMTEVNKARKLMSGLDARCRRKGNLQTISKRAAGGRGMGRGDQAISKEGRGGSRTGEHSPTCVCGTASENEGKKFSWGGQKSQITRTKHGFYLMAGLSMKERGGRANVVSR